LIINKDEILIVILAGGLSSRFGGGFKTLAKFNNKSILDRIIGKLINTEIEITINANSNEEEFLKKKISIIPDIDKQYQGPLAGIYASMKWSSKNYSNKKWIFTIPSDTPFLPNNLIDIFLTNFSSTKKIFIARSYKKPHPVIGMWNIDLIENLHNFLIGNNRKIMDWVIQNEYKFVDFNFKDYDCFFNINTEADLTEASKIEKEIVNK